MGDPLVESVRGKLGNSIARTLARHHLPGAAAGVVCGEQLAWSAGYGFADVATGRRPDADTVFRVASISKTFTATAVMQLRDEGRLRLDDPLVRFIPEFASVQCRKGAVEDVTLRRLLIHRSGLVTEGPFDYWHSMTFPTMAQILAALPRTEVVIEPDAPAAKYGNLAYALLGEVVARVSGRPYADYVRQEILEPLGMISSGFALADDMRRRKATGYDEHPFDDEPPPVRHTETEGIAAAAGLYTTVQGLARWIAFQFREDGGGRSGAQVLAGRTLAEMHHPQRIDATWTMGNCLGWGATRTRERIDIGHGGSIHGFITQISFNVPRRLGVIVLTNQGRHPAAGEIATEMMGILAAADDDAGAPGSIDQPLVPTPAAWRPLLGRYRMAGNEVQVECRRGRLRLETVPPAGRALHAPTDLDPTDDPHVFRVAAGRGAGELVRFEPGPGGTPSCFTLAGFVYARLEPLRRTGPETDS